MVERAADSETAQLAGGWDLSCPDWRERLREGRSMVPDLPLNLVRGEQAVTAFNLLRLADVPGTPTMAEAGGDWFRDIVRALFGSLTPDGRRRMIRELFCLVPKKNSKTTNGALMMVVALLLNERPRAPFIMTAPVQDVADLAFQAAAGAIALDPVLSRTLHIREHIKTIVHRVTKAELAIMTFDPAVLTGQKCAGVLIDELHVVAKMNKSASAIRQLRGGMLPYPEAFMAFITTQSEEAPSGVFHAELQKARGIRDGTRRGAMLPVLYEFPPNMQKNDDWRESKHWAMVNPNAGRSVTIPRLEEEFKVAEATSEPELRAWASQHLNVEIGLALHSDRWIGADFWAQNAIAITLDDLIARSEVITAGIDGGGLEDLLGLAFLGREEKTRNWLLWTHAWAHPKLLEKHKQEAPRLYDLAADGDLTIVKQIGDDIDELAAMVTKVEKSGLLDRVGVDQAGIGAIVEALEQIVTHERIISIPQGWRLMTAIKTTERQLAEGKFKHGNQRLMSWCVGNAKVEPKGNAILITKQGSGNAKIDALMATFDAVALMAQDPVPRKKRYDMFFVKPPKAHTQALRR